MKQLTIATLIGLPASGKTTLAHKLLEMCEQNSLDYGLIIISFDENISLKFDDAVFGEYKSRRELLFEQIEDLLKALCEKEFSVWQTILSTHSLTSNKKCYNIKEESPTLIILDDNFQYRSMRQRVRKICRHFQFGYFQIFLKVTLDKAKERNAKRSSRIPEEIIDKMNDQLEEPTNERTIHLDTNLFNFDDLVLSLNDRMKCPETFENHSKIPQQQSIIHEMDLITRKIIGVRIKDLKSNENMTLICASMNRKRKEFLDSLRAQTQVVDDVDSLSDAFNCFLDK